MASTVAPPVAASASLGYPLMRVVLIMVFAQRSSASALLVISEAPHGDAVEEAVLVGKTVGCWTGVL